MGALTGNKVKDTYLDVVQLGQAGAGLPSSIGEHALIYDGAGNVVNGILGRRTFLNPDPTASGFSETIETVVDKTNANLVSDGWTMVNCTAAVRDGFLVLTNNSGGAARISMYRSASLTGDFDFISGGSFGAPSNGADGTDMQSEGVGIVVVDTVGDIAHYSMARLTASSNSNYQYYTGYNGTYSTWSGFTTSQTSVSVPARFSRIARVSGTVDIGDIDPSGSLFNSAGTREVNSAMGCEQYATLSDSRTFNRVEISSRANINDGASVALSLVRRYA